MLAQEQLYTTRLMTEELWGVARIAYTRKWGFRDGDGVEQRETFLSFDEACEARDKMRGTYA